MRAKLTEELILAEMELRDAQADEIEIETVLDFAQMVLLNASNLWKTATSEQKTTFAEDSIPRGCNAFERRLSNRDNLLVFQPNANEFGQKRRFGSATGNRTRVLRLRISRPNP